MSFDYRTLLDFPEMANMLSLGKFMPESFANVNLRNLFLSNYDRDVLASTFHGAINHNWFFQCRGAKRWWLLDPKYMSYLGTFAHTIILLPSMYNEDLLAHLPLHMVDVMEGDMLFTPAFWMHAVATRPGLSMAVANRKFLYSQALLSNPFQFLYAGIQFPTLVTRLLLSKALKEVPYTLTALQFLFDLPAKDEKTFLYEHLHLEHDWLIQETSG